MHRPTPEFTAAVKIIYPRLRRFFAGKVGPVDAQDLAQATIAAYLEKDAPPTGNPKKFLFGIARNKLLQHYERSRGGARFDSLCMSVQQLATTLGTKLDRSMRVQAGLSELPLAQQIALELRYGEDLKLEELAAEMEVSRAQVVRYLHDGLAAMRKVLGEALAEDELGAMVEQDYRAR